MNAENKSPDPNDKELEFVYNSKIFKEFYLKREEILKYKWIESEKMGKDIGLDKAWLQWESKHYKKWKNSVSKPSS